jgi:hypothetical protein
MVARQVAAAAARAGRTGRVAEANLRRGDKAQALCGQEQEGSSEQVVSDDVHVSNSFQADADLGESKPNTR